MLSYRNFRYNRLEITEPAVVDSIVPRLHMNSL
jgi:hypothetical protein